MKISQQLKEKNIAEYLIYMWQVEDLLRANKCDIDLIRSNVISRYPAEEHAALEEWYGNLADMMRAEGVTEKGAFCRLTATLSATLRTCMPICWLPRSIPFIMRHISKRCLLLWNCGKRADKRKNPNWRPVLRRFTAYCCCVCRKRKSARALPRR